MLPKTPRQARIQKGLRAVMQVIQEELEELLLSVRLIKAGDIAEAGLIADRCRQPGHSDPFIAIDFGPMFSVLNDEVHEGIEQGGE